MEWQASTPFPLQLRLQTLSPRLPFRLGSRLSLLAASRRVIHALQSTSTAASHASKDTFSFKDSASMCYHKILYTAQATRQSNSLDSACPYVPQGCMQTRLRSRASLAMKNAHPAKDHQGATAFLATKQKDFCLQEILASDQPVLQESGSIWLHSHALTASSIAILVQGHRLSTASSACLRCC